MALLQIKIHQQCFPKSTLQNMDGNSHSCIKKELLKRIRERQAFFFQEKYQLEGSSNSKNKITCCLSRNICLMMITLSYSKSKDTSLHISNQF